MKLKFITLSILVLSGCSYFNTSAPLTLKDATKSSNVIKVQGRRYSLDWRRTDRRDRARVIRAESVQPKLKYPRPKLVVNHEVTTALKHFTDRDRAFVVKSYNNRTQYLEEMVELFEGEGVPLELINIAAIESAFEPKAVSRSGATGMWQFMKGTAQSYDLTTNFFWDDRRDPSKSTWAAARHLSDLYERFGDWHLALAAYNGGVGAVSRAINAGGSRDFWTLARNGHLRKQTADYVPRFIAMTIIMENLDEYGFVEMAGELRVGSNRTG